MQGCHYKYAHSDGQLHQVVKINAVHVLHEVKYTGIVIVTGYYSGTVVQHTHNIYLMIIVKYERGN